MLYDCLVDHLNGEVPAKVQDKRLQIERGAKASKLLRGWYEDSDPLSSRR